MMLILFQIMFMQGQIIFIESGFTFIRTKFAHSYYPRTPALATMPITETERRPYNLTDPEAMTHCSAMLVAFVARQAQFAAHDPLFGGSYAADWKSAIDLCYATATDDAIQDLQRSHTQAV